jgi:hypothetical protein
MVLKSLGEKADWKAVDVAMLRAAGAAEKVAVYKHQKLSALRIIGETPRKATDGTVDELLARIKGELSKLSQAFPASSGR